MTTFTTHSAGQVITSADINLIQTAVNTLERGGSGWTFTNGVANYPAQSLATTSTTTTGRLNLSGFIAGKSFTAANIIGYASAAGTSVTLFKYGLYTLDSSGNGTLVASTANQSTAANGFNGVRSYALSSSYAVTAGTAYALALLSVGGNAPQYACNTTTAFNGAISGIAQPFLFAGLDSQTDLPSSFTYASLTPRGFGFYQVITT